MPLDETRPRSMLGSSVRSGCYNRPDSASCEALRTLAVATSSCVAPEELMTHDTVQGSARSANVFVLELHLGSCGVLPKSI
mmetsp:Transcript_11794/g.20604  ORF Transcript_11794/g.20604 Transcript_11794/m.20604 type:complete len:81 (+) Transcript_11794:114-356(+)